MLEEHDLDSCWKWTRVQLADLFLFDARPISSIDIATDVRTVASRVRAALRDEPPVEPLTFFWFGLFDGLRNGTNYAGYYFLGGTSPDAAAAVKTCVMPYSPADRYLFSDAVESVYQQSLPMSEERLEISYLGVLLAAAVISKFAIKYLNLGQQVFVGHDSGDFFRVA